MKKLITASVIVSVIILAFTTWYVVTINKSCSVVTLMYHNITTNSAMWDDYCVPPDVVESDIKYYQDNGYVSMTATELAKSKMEDIRGKKVLLVTLDDGYTGWYTDVFPILKKLNAKATMFVVGSCVGTKGYMNADQIKEMSATPNVEIGSHTYAIHSKKLDEVKTLYANSPNDVLADLKKNNETLKSITGRDVTSMSWPYGYYTQPLDTAVKSQLGITISFSTHYGITLYTGNRNQPLNRVNREYNSTTLSLFTRTSAKLSPVKNLINDIRLEYKKRFASPQPTADAQQKQP